MGLKGHQPRQFQPAMVQRHPPHPPSSEQSGVQSSKLFLPGLPRQLQLQIMLVTLVPKIQTPSP
ncbi:hypothetical protein MJO28_016141 [Puccinia striiformis f. sp. tritici]|uniref:Uncharacterized protein n=1 Tax=Puccinia striiformis f. sp. tritici TaxID=168172 RepID=A0ACC0DRT1_9BASI|nr:hypothetical protein MJO28_016141 [Puccinia striiformis f. sp. tritici]